MIHCFERGVNVPLNIAVMEELSEYGMFDLTLNASHTNSPGKSLLQIKRAERARCGDS
jgi:hypothetical protein